MIRPRSWFVAWLVLSAWVTNAVELEGNAVQGGLLIGLAPKGSVVTVDSQPVPVASSGVFAIGIARDRTEPLQIEVQDGDSLIRTARGIAPRSFAIERIDGLPQDTVTPPPELLERIAREAERVAIARQRRDDRTDFLDGFLRPAVGRLSGFYGSQRILNGEPKNPHWGLDIAAPEGAAVVAPAAGVVTLAEPELFYSGGTLIIDHGLGVSSTFLHLSRLDVDVGQSVSAGQRIGAVGSTGRATGPHLDWRVNVGSVRVDPQLLLPQGR